jgi:IS1 family transposase
MAEDTRGLIDRLLVARMARRGLWRAVGVQRKGRLGVLRQGVAALAEHLPGQPIPGHRHVMLSRLAVAAAAMASVGPKQANKPWRGSAMEAKRRQVLACAVGARSRRRAKRLGAEMPEVSRHQATFDTEQEVVDDGVSPAAPPRARTKGARTTHHLKRCNPTRRPRVSRLVRAA